MNKNTVMDVDRHLKELIQREEFSGVVLVAMGDSIIMGKGYGMANQDLDVPNTIKTKFCIASITKSITAMAIAILADQKKLQVEDTLDQYIPDYPNGDKITLYHILTHTSGICEIYKDLEETMFGHRNNALKELIDQYKHRPLDFEPGTKFQYSNYGYSLLAYIIEKVSGKTYGQFVKENIFDKLSMGDTGCYENEKVLKNKANGYGRSEKGIVNAANINLSNLMGSGNLYGTVEDLFTWTRALQKGELLSPDYSKRLFTDFIHVEDHYYYGYGFVIYKPEEDMEYIYQDGGLPGFRSTYKIYPKRDLTIIVLSNYEQTKCFKLVDEIEQLL